MHCTRLGSVHRSCLGRFEDPLHRFTARMTPAQLDTFSNALPGIEIRTRRRMSRRRTCQRGRLSIRRSAVFRHVSPSKACACSRWLIRTRQSSTDAPRNTCGPHSVGRFQICLASSDPYHTTTLQCRRPVRGWPSAWRLATSHSRRVPSSLAGTVRPVRHPATGTFDELDLINCAIDVDDDFATQ